MCFQPDRPDELKRIHAAGGRVIYWDGARVLGVLAMSRAIGNNLIFTVHASFHPRRTIALGIQYEHKIKTSKNAVQ